MGSTHLRRRRSLPEPVPASGQLASLRPWRPTTDRGGATIGGLRVLLDLHELSHCQSTRPVERSEPHCDRPQGRVCWPSTTTRSGHEPHPHGLACPRGRIGDGVVARHPAQFHTTLSWHVWRPRHGRIRDQHPTSDEGRMNRRATEQERAGKPPQIRAPRPHGCAHRVREHSPHLRGGPTPIASFVHSLHLLPVHMGMVPS